MRSSACAAIRNILLTSVACAPRAARSRRLRVRTSLCKRVHCIRKCVPRNRPSAKTSIGKPRSITLLRASSRPCRSTDPTASAYTSRASCSPRTTTSSTSSLRDCCRPITSTQTRAYACRVPSLDTKPRSVPIHRPPATTMSITPIFCSSPDRTPRGRTRSCLGESKMRS